MFVGEDASLVVHKKVRSDLLPFLFFRTRRRARTRRSGLHGTNQVDMTSETITIKMLSE